MSTLNSLKMVNSKKPTAIPPVLHRRNKLATKVWEQVQLAKAIKEGGVFVSGGSLLLTARYVLIFAMVQRSLSLLKARLLLK